MVELYGLKDSARFYPCVFGPGAFNITFESEGHDWFALLILLRPGTSIISTERRVQRIKQCIDAFDAAKFAKPEDGWEISVNESVIMEYLKSTSAW